MNGAFAATCYNNVSYIFHTFASAGPSKRRIKAVGMTSVTLVFAPICGYRPVDVLDTFAVVCLAL